MNEKGSGLWEELQPQRSQRREVFQVEGVEDGVVVDRYRRYHGVGPPDRRPASLRLHLDLRG